MKLPLTSTRGVAPAAVGSRDGLGRRLRRCTVGRNYGPLWKTCRRFRSVPAPLVRRWVSRLTASPPGGTSNRGAAAPLIGRFKGMGFLREGGNRNPPSLRQLFGDFLAAQKVTRPQAKHLFYIKFSNTTRRADEADSSLSGGNGRRPKGIGLSGPYGKHKFGKVDRKRGRLFPTAPK